MNKSEPRRTLVEPGVLRSGHESVEPFVWVAAVATETETPGAQRAFGLGDVRADRFRPARPIFQVIEDPGRHNGSRNSPLLARGYRVPALQA